VGAKRKEGRNFCRLRPSRNLGADDLSALASDMAQPIIVTAVTTESCAALGPN